jgi:hypothetical protein
VVSGDQVCRVQHAILWRNSAWQPAKCEGIAAALDATRDPPRMLAVCINESDLREDVVSVVRPGVYDVGLCGIRCDLRSTSGKVRGRSPAGGLARAPSGSCQNGSARGYTLRQLLDGATSVRLADKILHDTHGGSLRRYNGGTREHGYAGRVGAILAALGGVDAFAKCRHRGEPRRETRVEKLTRQILEALGKGKRS